MLIINTMAIIATYEGIKLMFHTLKLQNVTC